MSLEINHRLNYRGRFAPSPTGPLHFGSLIAAVGSYLDARSQNGAWILRMEDVDRPRCQPGAADEILRTLTAFGFAWDGPVLYQSQRHEAYRAAFESLRRDAQVFACACTRRELADSRLMHAIANDGALIYPGTCRNSPAPGRSARAWRLRVDNAQIDFDDRLQGRITQQLALKVGDFILLRVDGLFAYQLAVVVDDGKQGITHIVRGADLLESTSRQIYLQQLLGLPTPSYAHLPVAINAQGEKLSKQTLAAPLQITQAGPLLCAALAFLGQQPPADLHCASLAEVWRWAHAHWRFEQIPHQHSLSAPSMAE